MSNLKDGDRVVTNVKLWVIGHSDDWVEAGAEGLIIGATEQEGYLLVKLDGVKLPTYVREANLNSADPNAMEDISFADSHCTVEFWPGNELNKPWVGFNIKTYYTKYDRDYGTEEEITGNHEFELDDMVKLRDFLNTAIEKAQKWEVDKG